MKLLFLALALPCVFAQPGAPSNYTPQLNDDIVQEAVRQINTFYGDNVDRTAVRVISATKQVVSGFRYKLKLEISGGEENQICTVDIWDQSWRTPRYVLSEPIQCQAEENNVQTRSLLGGQREVSIDDNQVQQALAQVLTYVNQRSNNLYYFGVESVEKVTRQTVNGVIYRFTNLKLGESSCSRNQGFSSENVLTDCPVNSNSRLQWQHDVEVYRPSGSNPTYRVTVQ